MFGFWNVNKPAGVTSRWVVDQAVCSCPGEKVGHAGTLDPLATGVLVVAVGPATRLISFVQQGVKRYQATFQLGCSSPSDDLETELVPVALPADLTAERIQEVLPTFTGTILQQPPAFSAVKYEGRRAYRLARRGAEVSLSARPVTVQALQLRQWQPPYLELDITCGSGTYIRSLGRDLAAALGTAAVMTRLTRWQVGGFRLEESITTEQLAADPLGYLVPPLAALASLPQIVLASESARDLAHGRPVPCTPPPIDVPRELAAIDQQGRLLAIVRADPDGRCWPVRNFS